MYNFSKPFLFFLSAFFLFSPLFSFAQTSVAGCDPAKQAEAKKNSFLTCGFDLNCNGIIDNKVGPGTTIEECGFNDIIATITKIINWLIIFAVSITVLIMAYVGWMFMTAGDSQDKVKRAKGMFWNVIWGFVIMLSAWFIVNIVEKTLIADDSGIKSYLKKPTSP